METTTTLDNQPSRNMYEPDSMAWGSRTVAPKTQLLILFGELVVLLLQQCDSFRHLFEFVFGTGGKLLDDLEHTPQSTDHDK